MRYDNSKRRATADAKLVGKKFWRLTVIERIGSFLHCSCACGKDIFVKPIALQRARPTRSCGCLQREIVSATNPEAPLIKAYKWTQNYAKNNSTHFEIPLALFKLLITSDCHYCGRSPEQLVKTRGGHFLFRNGIDRMDPRIGYIPENCVPCCKDCNFRKRNSNYQEFMDWIEKVHAHIECR